MEKENTSHLCPAELRFIEAFHWLSEHRRIGLLQFCHDVDAFSSTFSKFLKMNTTRRARVDWFSELCKYGVSAEWLLTGRGEMLTSDMDAKKVSVTRGRRLKTSNKTK